MKNLREMKISFISTAQSAKVDIKALDDEEVNIIKTISKTVSERDAALSRKERIAKEIEMLQAEDADVDRYILGIDEKLEAYGSIRYTEEFLEMLIQEELLRSKRENLIRLKDEVMKGEATVISILALIDMDPIIKPFIACQHEGSKIGRLFKTIVGMGGGTYD